MPFPVVQIIFDLKNLYSFVCLLSCLFSPYWAQVIDAYGIEVKIQLKGMDFKLIRKVWGCTLIGVDRRGGHVSSLDVIFPQYFRTRNTRNGNI